jgi:hypothetical protein
MRIFKKDIISAMSYPNLRPGYLVDSNSEVSKKPLEKIPDLPMCAVAVVLRMKRGERGTVGEFVHYCMDWIGQVNYKRQSRTELPTDAKREEEIVKLKAANQYLELLSCEYEYLSEKYETNPAYAKGELTKFINKHFPNFFDAQQPEYHPQKKATPNGN